MRRAVHAGLAALLLVGVLAAPAAADPPTFEERSFTVALSGANEVSGRAGDPDGTGTARVFLHQGRGQVCFIIRVSNIGDVILSTSTSAPPGSTARLSSTSWGCCRDV